MPSPDELERLAAYLEGALSADEARSMEEALARDPSLRTAKAAMERTDALLAALPLGLPDEAAERIVQAAVAPPPTVSRRTRAALRALGGLVALLAIVATAGWLRPVPPARVVPLEPSVTTAAIALPTGARFSQAEGWAAIALPAGVVHLLGPGSIRAGPDGRIELQEGALLVDGEGLGVDVGAASLTVRGRALVGAGTAEGALRGTTPEPTRESLVALSNLSAKQLAPLVVGLVAGAGLTVVVLRGEAALARTGEPTRTLQAGERLAPEAPPRAGPQALAPIPPPPSPTPAAAATELASLPRAALEQEVLRLRDERERLLRAEATLRKELDGKRFQNGEGSYARLPKEELLAYAERGRLRIRLPHLTREGALFGDEVVRDVGLTPEERAAIEKIYDDSRARLRDGLAKLYLEVGGEQAVADSSGAEALFHEIRQKSHKEDMHEAVRRASRERAGLQPSRPDGPPIERAVRLLWSEDERVVDEVSRLLGEDRGARLLDHPEAQHADWTTEVGPGTP